MCLTSWSVWGLSETGRLYEACQICLICDICFVGMTIGHSENFRDSLVQDVRIYPPRVKALWWELANPGLCVYSRRVGFALLSIWHFSWMLFQPNEYFGIYYYIYKMSLRKRKYCFEKYMTSILRKWRFIYEKMICFKKVIIVLNWFQRKWFYLLKYDFYVLRIIYM